MNADGLMHVSAKDKATSKEQKKITIQSSGGLSEEQIQDTVRQSEQFAEEDKKRKELVGVKNNADSLCYTAEKNLEEHKSKLPQNIIDDVNTAMSELRAVKEKDLENIKMAIQKLNQALMKIGEAISGASDKGSRERTCSGKRSRKGSRIEKRVTKVSVSIKSARYRNAMFLCLTLSLTVVAWIAPAATSAPHRKVYLASIRNCPSVDSSCPAMASSQRTQQARGTSRDS